MTRERNLDDVLREWVDHGVERLPHHHLTAALAEIETTSQHGPRPALLEGFIMRIQPFAIPIGVVAALVLAVGAFALASRPPSVGPQPSSSPTEAATTAEPSRGASISPSADVQRAASEAVVEEIRGPVPLRAFADWIAKSRDPSLGTAREPGSLNGYIFTPDSTGRYFTIYLDPTHDYGEGATTARDDLKVLIAWNFMNRLDPAQRGSGSFTSELGECALTFEAFTQAEIAGAIDCVDVPGTYTAGTEGGTREGVIERLLASFSFDPVADAYVLPAR